MSARQSRGGDKTVTALLWNAAAKRESEWQTPLWIGLDAYDNIPSVFYKLFAVLICSTQPNNQNMRAILMDPAFSASPVAHRAAFDRVAV